MILMIDNYDSFTYNLVQYLGELGEPLEVYRNDTVTVDELLDKKPDSIVISPGPGKPEDAGICIDVIKRAYKNYPLLGICLGHQCIATAFGAKVVKAQRLMHGKTSVIHHCSDGLFKDIPDGFEATRYHSLIIDPDTVGNTLEVIAYAEENEIMGIKHKQYPVWGLQFHPESIKTVHGKQILKNFVDLSKKEKK